MLVGSTSLHRKDLQRSINKQGGGKQETKNRGYRYFERVFSIVTVCGVPCCNKKRKKNDDRDVSFQRRNFERGGSGFPSDRGVRYEPYEIHRSTTIVNNNAFKSTAATKINGRTEALSETLRKKKTLDARHSNGSGQISFIPSFAS